MVRFDGPADLFARVERLQNELLTWRRELHRRPELSFQEKQTAAFVREILAQKGIASRGDIAGHGVVAEIGFGTPIVGLRADMDALPIQEKTECAFASENSGVMHACGHDAHTAMLLAAAWVLKDMADAGLLRGRVRLIFQPAEEQMDASGRSGGRRMVEEGVVEGLSALFAQHVSPAVPTGQISFFQGAITASSDQFSIMVHGRSAHAGYPHQGTDAIVVAATLVQAVQQIVSRRLDPLTAGVISIGTIEGGTAPNIVAGKVQMNGTIRAFDEESRALLKAELTQVCRLAEALGATAECVLVEGYPVGKNDPAITALAEEAITAMLGPSAIHPPFAASAGAEDFAFMAACVPATLLRLGVRNPQWDRTFGLHTDTFQIDESALVTGAAALVAAAMASLTRISSLC